MLILIFLATSKYTLGPVLIRFRVSASVNPTFNEISDEDAQRYLPPNFFGIIRELEALGFSVVCHLSTATITKRVHTLMTLLVNRSSQTHASIAFMRTMTANAPMAVNYLEFHSDFEDGSQLDTNNASVVKMFYDVPGKFQARIPHLKDPNALYQVHLYLMKKRNSAAVLPEPGKESERFINSVRQSLADQVTLGFYVIDEKKQRYRHTWRSAFRGAYRLLWPMKQIRLRRQEREGRRVAEQAAMARLS
jgi:hypothetical protein